MAVTTTSGVTDLFFIDGGGGGGSSISNMTITETAVAYTVTVDDDIVIASGTITISLLALVGALKSVSILANTATVTVDPAGTETIDGSLTATLTVGQSITIAPTSTGWLTI